MAGRRPQPRVASTSALDGSEACAPCFVTVSADDAQANELRAALAAIPGTLRTRVLY